MYKGLIILLLPLLSFGQNYPGGQTISPNTSYCFRGGGSYTDIILPLPVDSSFFRVSEYGIVGDSVTDNTDSIKALKTIIHNYVDEHGSATVYFKEGDYLTDTLPFNKAGITIRGKSKTATTIINRGNIELAGNCKYESIGLQDYNFLNYTGTKNITFESVRFTTTSKDFPSAYLSYWGYYSGLERVTYEKCDFVYDSIYIGVHAYNYGLDTLIVNRCTFSGNYASHPIRIDRADRSWITSNNVSGGITGIFSGSNRFYTLQNISILGNTVHGQSEEGISFDGFGNNTSLCPIIGQGRIDSAYNNGGNKTVLKVFLLYRVGTHPADVSDTLRIADRTDWTNFYFSFGDNSDFTGKYYRITAYDTTRNTLTIDTTINKALVDSGWSCSVDAGFFNCTVANNTVYNSGITGISLWLNCFNFNVYGNNIYDCPNGMNIAGGLMLNLYQTKAWRMNIHDNTFTNCSNWAAKFSSEFSNTIKQYDNIFKDNILNGNTLVQEDQLRFTNTGNTP